MPESALLQPGDQSRVLVNAHYDDGRTVDVTHWSQFTATDESVAGVDDNRQGRRSRQRRRSGAGLVRQQGRAGPHDGSLPESNSRRTFSPTHRGATSSMN